jgi:Flp pilus assembly protein TadG
VIAGWLAKIVVVIALLGFAAVELGSPVWTRAQVDGIAHDAADEAAHAYDNTHDGQKARTAAEDKAKHDSATVTGFTGPDTQGLIHVTVFRSAKSYLLHKFGPTKDWYDVSVTASSKTNAQ